MTGPTRQIDSIILRPYRRHARKAEFYRWCAIRGHTVPGNDPLTGRPMADGPLSHENRAASREAYKAMARYHLDRARALRTGPEALPRRRLP